MRNLRHNYSLYMKLGDTGGDKYTYPHHVQRFSQHIAYLKHMHSAAYVLARCLSVCLSQTGSTLETVE